MDNKVVMLIRDNNSKSIKREKKRKIYFLLVFIQKHMAIAFANSGYLILLKHIEIDLLGNYQFLLLDDKIILFAYPNIVTNVIPIRDIIILKTCW